MSTGLVDDLWRIRRITGRSVEWSKRMMTVPFVRRRQPPSRVRCSKWWATGLGASVIATWAATAALSVSIGYLLASDVKGRSESRVPASGIEFV